MNQIDAHQHFWRYSPERFGWIAPDGPLACDRLPGDVRPLLDQTGFDGCIAVQAEQAESETDWLLSLAADHDWILGVVGWTDLLAPDLHDRLARWSGTALVGIRHMVQDDPDPNWLMRAEARAGVRAVLAHGLAYDILVRSNAQMAQVPAFLDAVGDGAIVLDHGGKPDIAGGEWRPWADTIQAVAERPQIVCKLSGLVTEADHAAWSAGEIDRYLDHLLACFGPERLMFGSDWPVCTLAADHGQVVALVEAFVQRTCPDHRDAIFGETAQRVYKLGGVDA